MNKKKYWIFFREVILLALECDNDDSDSIKMRSIPSDLGSTVDAQFAYLNP